MKNYKGYAETFKKKLRGTPFYPPPPPNSSTACRQTNNIEYVLQNN